MPVYNYKVRDKFGLLIKGRTVGVNLETVAASLRSLNYTILSVTPLSSWEEHLLAFKMRFQKVGGKEILLFTRQLASMIHAGLPILSSLGNIIQQTQNWVLKKVLEQIFSDIEKGTSFASAVEKHPAYFSKFFVSMINVGEISGRLDEVLNRLVIIGKQEAEIRSKLKSILFYPVILLILAMTVISILLIFVLPRFISVYGSMGVDLPLATRSLLGLSAFLKNFWWAVAATVVVGIILFRKYRSTSQGRFNIDQFLLKVPIFGQLILKYNLARFSRTFGSLIKSGLPVLQGLAVTENTLNSQVIVTIIKDLRSSILEGQSISEQLKLSGVFPPMVIQMISAGEQTGKLDDMLMEVADFYDIEVDYEIRNLTTLLEPLLLVVMGCLILFMALAVLKPIFNLTRVIRG
ncbi:MAG: type II secretion system F family protein [Candidatus Aureabacteria bacterium]|nr:type II secretion system F family protein [Candidatus Auribacterota bacterium]